MTDAVEELRKRYDELGLGIHKKPDYQVWWHAAAAVIVQGVFWVLFVVTFGVVSEDFNAYYTTLGSVVYIPEDSSLDMEGMYTVLCEELAHRYDDVEHGLAYKIGYILWPPYRATVEMRGRGMQLVGSHRRYGEIPNSMIKRAASSLSGASYLWAANEEEVREVLSNLREALRSGRLDPEGLYDPNEERYESVDERLEL